MYKVSFCLTLYLCHFMVTFSEALIRGPNLCRILKTFKKEETEKTGPCEIMFSFTFIQTTGQPHAGDMQPGRLLSRPCFPLDSPLEQQNSDDYDDDEDHSQDWAHDPEHLWLLCLSAHAAGERHHHGLREGTGCKRALLRGGSTFSQLFAG